VEVVVLAVVAPRPLWATVRWPVLLLALGALGVLVAVVLDRTSAYEYALTVGAPSLWVVAAALVWLLVAVVVHAVRRHGRST
jgi:hypothetical protein